MKDYSFCLPIRNCVDRFKKMLLPPIISEETKAYCDVTEMIKQTVASLLEINEVSPAVPIDVKAKFGLDGSGSHQVQHQKVAVAVSDTDAEKNESSYIGSYWCPLEVRTGDDVVWKNPLPNSIIYTRPICIMSAKETREVVKEHFKPFMDGLHALELEPVPLQVSDSPVPMNVN